MNTSEPLELTLRPKKTSAIGALLYCSVAVAVGVSMVMSGQRFGYFFAGFFGLLILVALVQLLPGSSWLRISEEGLTFSSLFRVYSMPWRDIDHFFVVGRKRSRMIGLNFVPSYDGARMGRRVSRALGGCDGALRTYGMDAQELADLLNTCLARFTAPPNVSDTPRNDGRC